MRPTIVLVHGAFAESSSWDGVVDPLDGRQACRDRDDDPRERRAAGDGKERFHVDWRMRVVEVSGANRLS